MKGIILAGGTGTRLYPATTAYSKQLVPVYDKPMIYYPLSILMLAGIRDIILITTKEDQSLFIKLLGDGSHLGINLIYKIQEAPRGLPEAFLISKDEIKGENVLMILGDNIFYGDTFVNTHIIPVINQNISTVFAHKVKDPSRYGVVEMDESLNVLSLEEKPKKPKSNFAITGLYYFDSKVASYCEELTVSERGEIEIVDLIKKYVEEEALKVQLLGRGIAWLDSGTHESLLDASLFIQTIEKRQGFKIACLEEIAFMKGFISLNHFKELASKVKGSYGDYLNEIILSESRQ